MINKLTFQEGLMIGREEILNEKLQNQHVALTNRPDHQSLIN